ncbi:Thymidylate synthase [Geodia barretti]|uniref:Thymidylate synthase n=1 Tax=Geodia barretti TaxID=519541 RepID=A0AA35W4D4_GEOBA|nr:Thymidylate synthase [Geodia barretti]
MEVGENVSSLANVISSPPDKMKTTASHLNYTNFLFVYDVTTITVMYYVILNERGCICNQCMLLASEPAVVSVPRALSPRRHDEHQYLDLIRTILEHGQEKGDRTGVGTRSIFGEQMRFNLRDQFPLLTTKRVFWRGVVEELLWFISGEPNAKHLSQKNIKIWDANGSRDFLDKRGLHHREEGDPDNRTNPNDRRIIMSTWNPRDRPEMALPPCHAFVQFYASIPEISRHGDLLQLLTYFHCKKSYCSFKSKQTTSHKSRWNMPQVSPQPTILIASSSTQGLGVPFNIASYSLLTYMIALICNLKPGDFVHTLTDAHVYLNHIQPLTIQLQRSPRPFPRLELRRQVSDIDKFVYDDIILHDYQDTHGHGCLASFIPFPC